MVQFDPKRGLARDEIWKIIVLYGSLITKKDYRFVENSTRNLQRQISVLQVASLPFIYSEKLLRAWIWWVLCRNFNWNIYRYWGYCYTSWLLQGLCFRQYSSMDGSLSQQLTVACWRLWRRVWLQGPWIQKTANCFYPPARSRWRCLLKQVSSSRNHSRQQ